MPEMLPPAQQRVLIYSRALSASEGWGSKFWSADAAEVTIWCSNTQPFLAQCSPWHNAVRRGCWLVGLQHATNGLHLLSRGLEGGGGKRGWKDDIVLEQGASGSMAKNAAVGQCPALLRYGGQGSAHPISCYVRMCPNPLCRGTEDQ